MLAPDGIVSSHGNRKERLEWLVAQAYNQNHPKEDRLMPTVEAPLELVEAFAELRLPPKTDALLRGLMDRNTKGLLNDAEREELEALVELSERLVLLRAQALRVLGRKPA